MQAPNAGPTRGAQGKAAAPARGREGGGCRPLPSVPIPFSSCPTDERAREPPGEHAHAWPRPRGGHFSHPPVLGYPTCQLVVNVAKHPIGSFAKTMHLGVASGYVSPRCTRYQRGHRRRRPLSARLNWHERGARCGDRRAARSVLLHGWAPLRRGDIRPQPRLVAVAGLRSVGCGMWGCEVRASSSLASELQPLTVAPAPSPHMLPVADSFPSR